MSDLNANGAAESAPDTPVDEVEQERLRAEEEEKMRLEEIRREQEQRRADLEAKKADAEERIRKAQALLARKQELREQIDVAKAEEESLKQKTNEINAFVKAARETVKELPTQADVDRVQKDIKKLEKLFVTGSTTGEPDNDECATLAARRLSIEEFYGRLSPLHQKGTPNCENLEKRLAAVRQESIELSNNMDRAQQSAEDELPKLDAEKEETITLLRSSWEQQQQYLQKKVFDLTAISREHQYHLSRGSHIKAAPQEMGRSSELKLDEKQHSLAEKLSMARTVVGDLDNELLTLNRDLKHLKKENKEQRARQDANLKKLLEEAHVARRERESMEFEQRNLRNLKAELHGVLQVMREAVPRADQTPQASHRSNSVTPPKPVFHHK